jgi:hypothetical protein
VGQVFFRPLRVTPFRGPGCAAWSCQRP